jgi:hypothetical protein
MKHVGGEEVQRGIWWGRLGAGDHFKGPGLDERIICITGSLRIGVGGMDWIDLARDRDW